MRLNKLIFFKKLISSWVDGFHVAEPPQKWKDEDISEAEINAHALSLASLGWQDARQ